MKKLKPLKYRLERLHCRLSETVPIPLTLEGTGAAIDIKLPNEPKAKMDKTI